MITILVHLLFIIAVLTALVVIPYILGSKAMFIYGLKEGFVSILSKGIENGAFHKVVGVMKEFIIKPDGEIVDDDPNNPTKPMGWMGLIWIGLWPLFSAMKFDTEQIKIVNNDDGSTGLKKEEFKQTIYLPIQSTERLVVKGLELSDLGSKIDFDAVITFRMRNVYIAKMKNRGSIKILKSNVEEGLKETASDLDYPAALKLKNATTAASMQKLVDDLNSRLCGYGTLVQVTGYELISINIVGVELSGANSAEMVKAFGSIVIADKAAKVTEIEANASKIRLEREGEGKAKAAAVMMDQTARRIELQKTLSDQQAIALAFENGATNTNAQVINFGGGQGASAMLPLENKPKKKDDKKK